MISKTLRELLEIFILMWFDLFTVFPEASNSCHALL